MVNRPAKDKDRLKRQCIFNFKYCLLSVKQFQPEIYVLQYHASDLHGFQLLIEV